MSSIKKFELEVELKSPADAFWNTMKDINVMYPKLFPDIYKSIEILEGDGKSAGSIRLVTFTEDTYNLGFTEKSKLEYIDDDKKTLAYTYLEGRSMKGYKYFQEITTVKPAPAPGNVCVMVWTCRYEKQAEYIPGPECIKDTLIQMFHTLDDYTLANYNNNKS